MSRLFVGNFSFEQARDPGHNLSRSISRFEAELACLWLAVAQSGDEILCSVPFPPEEQDRLEALVGVRPTFLSLQQLNESRATEIVPWGWTPAIRTLAATLRIPISAPEQEVVWRVNSREFGLEFSQTLNCALPGECLVRGLPELMPAIQAIHQTGSGWIIKPNHGQAGRGQLWGEGPFLSESQFATVLHLISRQGVVVVEPRLQPILELGCQWEISPQGEVELLGLTQLITDAQGRYRGTSLNDVDVQGDVRETLVTTQRQALERLRAAGYFGPVGIDAMLFRDGETVRLRPLPDVNARWTMGRIAWEWGRRFSGHKENSHMSKIGTASAAGSWMHAESPPSPSALALSPPLLEGSPVRCRTWWVEKT